MTDNISETITSSLDLEKIAAFLALQPPHKLRTTTLHNAWLQPMRGLSGGVMLGPDLDIFRQKKQWKSIDSFDVITTPETCLDGEYIYGGPIGHLHFGHVMAEFVHRIVPSIQRFGAGRFIFVARHRGPDKFETLPSWLQDIFAFLGISSNNIKIINSPCRVEHLHICQQGSCLGGDPEKSYLDLLSSFSSYRIASLNMNEIEPKNIYVSRSNLPPGGNFLGEYYIESLLRKKEVSIVYPEKLYFAQQFATYKAAKKILFCEGSAAHGCQLFGSSDLNDVILIGKREISTYKKVLTSRSKKFHVQSGNKFLGSLFRNPKGQPLKHRGIHMFDMNHIISTLQTHQFADISQIFCHEDYITAVKNDFNKYIQYCMGLPALKIGEYSEISEFIGNFDRIINECRAPISF